MKLTYLSSFLPLSVCLTPITVLLYSQEFNFTALLTKTSKHKAAGARSQSYLPHNTSDTDYWSLLTDEK